MRRPFFLFFFATLNLALFAEPTPADSLSNNLQWLKLVHYKSSAWGGLESEVDGPSFFNCPTGKSDPKCEFEATRKKFEEYDTNSVCLFPARFRWLAKNLHYKKVEERLAQCTEYQDFKKQIGARSVSLVFSSHYLNNPSSAFGHTFLRFNRKILSASGAPLELMDKAVEFSARVDTANALVYGVKGIFGMFRGEFSALPYFVKVRQYAAFDSRDLWSYELNLNSEEIDRLIDHLWEMRQTYFDYYYFTENCSYHILSALEAAKPDLELTSELPFYVIPTDTLKAASKAPGLVKEVTFRPSLRTKFEFRYLALDSKNQRRLKAIIDDGVDSLDPEISEIDKSTLMDLAVEYIDFRYPYEIQDPQSATSIKKRALLTRRSQIQVKSPEITIQEDLSEAPHLSHGSRRVSTSYIHSSDAGAGIAVSGRVALHDVMDPSVGFPKNAEIDFMATQIRYLPQQKRFWLDHATIAQIQSMSPGIDLHRPLSWRLEVGAKTVRDRSCDYCIAGFLTLGGGWTIEPGIENLSIYALAEGDLIGSTRLDGSKVSVAPGLRTGFIFSPIRSLNIQAYGYYRYRLFLNERTSYGSKAEVRYALSSSTAMGTSFESYLSRVEGAVNAYFYF